MKDKFFKNIDIPISEYPKDFIPKGSKAFVACDYATDGDATVYGFYDPKTGEFHIQDMQHLEEPK